MTPSRFGRRGSSRIGVAVLAGVLGWLATTAVIGVRPAAACSCYATSVAELSGWTDLGFVGTLISRDTAPVDAASLGESNVAHRFSVEQWIHGDPLNPDLASAELTEDEITVYSPGNGGACGFEVRTGERAAIFADRTGRRFTGSLCATMPAEVALAEIAPAAAESGIARLAVIGNFDGSLIAYFSVDGRFLGYAGANHRDETWQPLATSCDDGTHAASLNGLSVRVLSIASGEDVREPVTLAEDVGPQIARCAGPDELVIVEQTISGGLQTRDHLSDETHSVLGQTSGMFAATGESIAVVQYLDPGERLLLVEGVGGDRVEREIGRMERSADDNHRGYVSVASSPEGGTLGVVEGEYHGDGAVTSILRLYDASTGTELLARLFERESWGASWIDADHIGVAFGGDEVTRFEVLNADTLESVGRVGDWKPFHTVLFEGALWGLDEGTLYRAEFGQEPEAMFTLPTRTSSPVMVMAEPVERLAPPPTTAAASAAADATTSVDATPTTALNTASTGASGPTASTSNTNTNTNTNTNSAADTAAAPPVTTEGGGASVRLVGGMVAGVGAALAGFLLFRQFRRRPDSPATTSDV